jgi:hypothetical protein
MAHLKIINRHSPEATEENHENPENSYALNLELGVSRIKYSRFTASSNLLDKTSSSKGSHMAVIIRSAPLVLCYMHATLYKIT